jgi:hypothetical protein
VHTNYARIGLKGSTSVSIAITDYVSHINGRQTTAIAIVQADTVTITKAYFVGNTTNIGVALSDGLARTKNVSGNTTVAVSSTATFNNKGKAVSGSTVISVTSTPGLTSVRNVSAEDIIYINSGGWPAEAIVANRVFFNYRDVMLVQLPAPIIGDTDRIVLQTQVRHSRNGTRYQFKRTPTYEQLLMTFENIRYGDIDNIKDFFETTAGLDVKYIDQYSRLWIGVVSIDPIDFVSMGKYLTCPGGRVELFTFNIEFEGIMQ